MRDLAVLVPSRGRPDSVRRLAGSMRGSCRGDTKLILGLDADDQLDEYLSILQGYPEVEAVINGGLHQVVAWINHLAMPRVDEYRFLGHFGDDNLPRTEGWDLRVMEALTETPLAFANDLYPGRAPGSLCCHVFLRSEVVRAVGYFGPPIVRHMYVDPIWMAWGQAVGITYLDDVIIEHLHHSAGKSAHDATYAASEVLNELDADAYNAYMATDFNRDVQRIREGVQAWTPERINAYRRELNIPVQAGAVRPWSGGE